MAELCRSLIRDRREVTLFAHVLDSDNRDNDVPALKQLQDELDYKVDAFVPTGLDDVREFVAGARIVVGARMHACLNALSTGTPAIPLAYSRKFSPLLKDLAWHHTIDLRGRDSYVTEVIEKVEDFEALQADIGQLRSRADELLDSGVQVVRKAVDLS
jgi:polysaccharide pyruvyl transferase WcaK-like protein